MTAENQQSMNLQNVPEYSVSQLANRVKRTLEDVYGHVRIRGEISGYRGPHSSGHCYFALKDENARIDAVVWKGVFSRLSFKPEEGMEVIATGKVSSYPGSSKYQIVIDSLEPAGIGALMALLEERKKKLAAEGLFAEERKKPIPFLPATIGIITSPTGAVIRDMMHGFTERFPARVYVWPVRVQGETCAREVADAVRGFNALGENDIIPRPDLLIVARGGGSLEDLWGFNEEIVARAVAESKIPVISAVGHETDWTLIDLVADARAPTPTKAAEWAVPKYSELVERLTDFELRLSRTMRRYMEERRARLTGLQRALPRLQELVALPRQRLDSASARLGPALRANAYGRRTRYLSLQGRFLPVLGKILDRRRLEYQRISGRLTPAGLRHKLHRGTEKMETLHARSARAVKHILSNLTSSLGTHAKLMNSLGYQNVLKRGYVLVRDTEGHMIRNASGIMPGQKLDLELADGHVWVTADGETDPAPADKTETVKKAFPSAKRAGKREPEAGDAGQGSLF